MFLSLLSAVVGHDLAVFNVNRIIFYEVFNSYGSYCWIFGFGSWLNPLFLFSSVYLLFSKFCVLIIFQNFILLIIVLSQNFDDSLYFCSSMVNVQYIVHSFFIPIYIFLLFRTVPQLRPLSTSLIGLYLVALDVYSDLVVVYFFIDETEYVFAVLQLLFVITGQVVGAVSDVFARDFEQLSVVDKVIASLGFGRIWFTVNWWEEKLCQDESGMYGVLRQKHKIWDLLYEAFPTVALQIYASMTTNVPPQALVASIFISAVSISFSTMLYLGALLKVQEQENPRETSLGDSGQKVSALTVSPIVSSTTPNSEQRRSEAKPRYLALFVFMVSDFYIRSVPMVMMMAIVSSKWFAGEGIRGTVWRLMFGSLLFGVVATFELIANYKMRISSKRGLGYILKIFAASIFSSFYSMLCTLSVLKMDSFYAESVIFSKFMVEHGIRCVVALFFCIFCTALSDINSWYPYVLSALFVLCLVINAMAVHWIFRSEFSSAADSKQQQHNQQIDARSTELQVMERVHSDSEPEAGAERQTQPMRSMTMLTEEEDDKVNKTSPVSDTQDGSKEAEVTESALEINDIYDMITDVLDEDNGSDSNDI